MIHGLGSEHGQNPPKLATQKANESDYRGKLFF